MFPSQLKSGPRRHSRRNPLPVPEGRPYKVKDRSPQVAVQRIHNQCAAEKRCGSGKVTAVDLDHRAFAKRAGDKSAVCRQSRFDGGQLLNPPLLQKIRSRDPALLLEALPDGVARHLPRIPGTMAGIRTDAHMIERFAEVISSTAV